MRLTSPGSGQTTERSVQRRGAGRSATRLEKLDRVEFFLNEDPHRHALPGALRSSRSDVPARHEALSYVRAVGYLESGGAAKTSSSSTRPTWSTVSTSTSSSSTPASLDRRGRPVDSISADDLQIFENGELSEDRAPLRADANDLPIHACLLLDTSTSMDDACREAEDAALYFSRARDDGARSRLPDGLQRRAQPRGAVHQQHGQVLAGGLSGLVAEGETALHDSLIQTLFRFGGVRGQASRHHPCPTASRLEASDYTFEEVLEYARRSGVTIYSIGLSIDSRASRRALEAQPALPRDRGHVLLHRRSARAQAHLRAHPEREVRTQYVISYQSSIDETLDYRQIEVKTTASGLKAKTIRGYYPELSLPGGRAIGFRRSRGTSPSVYSLVDDSRLRNSSSPRARPDGASYSQGLGLDFVVQSIGHRRDTA